MRDFGLGRFGIFDTSVARLGAANGARSALADTGPAPSALLGVIGTDIAGDTSTTAVLTVGAPATVSTIDTIGDLDFFKVQLVAGQTYEIGMFAKIGGPSVLPLQDSYVELHDASGTIITAADGGASTTINTANSGLDAILTYTATKMGTYFVNARAFDNAPADGADGDLIGDYEVSVANITGQPVYAPYYAPSSPLYALDWGTQVDGTTRNPDGAETGHLTGNAFATPDDKGTGISGKNVIKIYFAKAGDLFVSEDPTQPSLPPATVAVGAADFERLAVFTALAEFSKVADVNYVETQVRDEADFQYFTYSGTPGPGVSLLGSMSPPQELDEGLALFNSGDYRWDAVNLAQGGFSFVTLIHEFGHGHGLAHPHDNGGHSGVMNGVQAEGAGVADYTTGDFALNQAVFTMMSYEDGWVESPYGNAPTDAGYGYLGGLMAFDVATVQDKYGVNEEWARGNDTYALKDVNAAGTFYTSIWDAAGIDQIVYDGAKDSLIDLREATLKYESGGGGRVSYADGIFGGFTIANGVVIENARTGSGSDKLIGNAAANTLAGNAGNDLLRGATGADRLEGGAGDDWLEGGAGADTLLGGKGGLDVFLIARDNAGSKDTILDFGTGDMLVTNVKIVDSNRDNIITQSKNKVFDLGAGSSVAITGESGKMVSTLYYSGSYNESGVDYFVYGTTKNAGIAAFVGKFDDYDFA
jgi:Ca2+-binding RTX toxin-like protein